MDNNMDVTITERKIGKTTYTIISRPSPTAKDTLHEKICKLIYRDISLMNLNDKITKENK